MAQNDISQEKSKGRLIFRGIIYFIMVVLICFLTIIFINVTLSSSDGTPPQLAGFRFFTTTKNNTNDDVYALLSKTYDISSYSVGDDIAYKDISSVTRNPIISYKKLVGIINTDSGTVFQLSNNSEYVEIEQSNIIGKVLFSNNILGMLFDFMKQPIGLIVCFAIPIIILIIFEMITLSIASKRQKLKINKASLEIEEIPYEDIIVNENTNKLIEKKLPQKRGIFGNKVEVEEVNLVLKQDYKSDDITQEFPIPTEDDQMKLDYKESLYEFPAVTPFEIQKEEIIISNDLQDVEHKNIMVDDRVPLTCEDDSVSKIEEVSIKPVEIIVPNLDITEENETINVDNEIDDIINHVINEIASNNYSTIDNNNTNDNEFSVDDTSLDSIFDFSTKLALDDDD